VPDLLPRIPTDALDGKPLRYRLLPEGKAYVIYSVGWNQTDEGGETVLKRSSKDPSPDPEAGDWVWRF
jgi:hypothetical protein